MLPKLKATHWRARCLTRGTRAPWWRVCDVRDVTALKAAVEEAAEALGDFSTLVNNRGRGTTAIRWNR